MNVGVNDNDASEKFDLGKSECVRACQCAMHVNQTKREKERGARMSLSKLV